MSELLFFMMIKPDGVKRGLIGQIISRFEKRGFNLVEMNMLHATEEDNTTELLARHYEEHSSKGFYPELIKFMASGSLIPMIWSGNLEVAREMVGATIPRNAIAGTIRGDFASSLPNNLIHCSDSSESAAREIGIWFPLRK